VLTLAFPLAIRAMSRAMADYAMRAEQDPLTGLLNRRGFVDTVSSRLLVGLSAAPETLDAGATVDVPAVGGAGFMDRTTREIQLRGTATGTKLRARVEAKKGGHETVHAS
jgi:hypothetical protein